MTILIYIFAGIGAFVTVFGLWACTWIMIQLINEDKEREKYPKGKEHY